MLNTIILFLSLKINKNKEKKNQTYWIQITYLSHTHMKNVLHFEKFYFSFIEEKLMFS